MRAFVLYSSLAPIAQVVEQLPFKEWVVGSNPTGRTKLKLLTYDYLYVIL